MTIPADLSESPSPFSRRRFLAAVAVSLPIATLAATAIATPGPAAAAPFIAGSANYQSLAPVRLADTRPEQNVGGFTRLDANTIRVQIAGRAGAPATLSAAVLNVTALDAASAGYVSVYPSGTARPTVSSVNVERGDQILANLVTVGVGASGSVDIFTNTPMNIVVDICGVYVAVAGAVTTGRYVSLAAAARVIDTRNRGREVTAGVIERISLASAVPTTATAVVVNLTVTENPVAGYWTAWAGGQARPNTSNVNTDSAGQTRANQAIIPLKNFAAIDIFASGGGHLIVDVAGYMTGPADAPSTDGLFVANNPYRTLDTRNVAALGRMYPQWIAEFDFVGRANAQAVVINLTATESRGEGYFTGYPARTQRPLASNLNVTAANQTIANHAILRNSTVGVAVYTQNGASVVVDVAGYFTGTPAVAVTGPPVNVVPPPPPAPTGGPLPYTLMIPRMGVTVGVYEGVSDSVVNRGVVGHWPGTGLVGLDHMVLFGHRTTHGGVLRQIHTIGPGDQIQVRDATGVTYTYEFVRRDITSSRAAAIFNAGLGVGQPSLYIVACSRPDFLPTSTTYRIVVSFVLVG